MLHELMIAVTLSDVLAASDRPALEQTQKTSAKEGSLAYPIKIEAEDDDRPAMNLADPGSSRSNDLGGGMSVLSAKRTHADVDRFERVDSRQTKLTRRGSTEPASRSKLTKCLGRGDSHEENTRHNVKAPRAVSEPSGRAAAAAAVTQETDAAAGSSQDEGNDDNTVTAEFHAASERRDCPSNGETY